MSDSSNKINVSQSKKKSRDRGKVQDVMRKQTFSHSLDDVLNVRKAPILEKQAHCSRVSFREAKSAEESSSNESFVSALSQNISIEGKMSQPSVNECLKVSFLDSSPSENTKNSNNNENLPTTSADTTEYAAANFLSESENDCLIVRKDFEETWLSYDEEVFPINTSKIFMDDEMDPSTEKYSEECLKTVYASTNEIEYAKLISSAASSNAFIETLTEDSNNQIEILMKIREEELTLNETLRAQVSELDNLKCNVDELVADLESSFQESYAEISETHQQELEAVKMEAKIEVVAMENQMKELSSKLLVAESQNEAKDELVNELNNRIQELETSLEKQEGDCQEELTGVMAKVIRYEGLVSAKNEVEEELMRDTKGSRDMADENLKENKSISNVSSFIKDMVAEAESEIRSEKFECNNFDRAAMVADLRRASLQYNGIVGDSAQSPNSSAKRLKVESSKVNVSNPTESATIFDRAAMVADFRMASLQVNNDVGDSAKTPKSSTMKFKRRIPACKLNAHEVPLLREENESLQKELKIVLEKCQEIETKLFETTEASKRIDLIEQENQSLKSDLKIMKEKMEEKEIDAQVKNQLLSEKEKLQSEMKRHSYLNSQVKVLEVAKADLESQLTDMKEKVIQLEREKNSCLLKRLSLDSALTSLKKENERLLSKNEELEKLAQSSLKEIERCSSLETKQLKQISGCNDNEEEFCSVRKASQEQQFMASRNQSFLDKTRSTFNLTSDATQYLEYVSAPPATKSTQTDVIYPGYAAESPQTSSESLETSHHAAVRRFTAEEFCPSCRPRSGRRLSLDQELQASWTERCEVEQQLVRAMAENEILREYITKFENMGWHASRLVEAGVPSTAIWLQLRTCMQSIVNDLTTFRQTQVKVGERSYYLLPNTNTTNPFDEPNTEHVSNQAVGERSSPEGGRESPKLTDNINDCESEFEGSDHVSVDGTLQQPEDRELVLDKPAEDALLEMVQDLLRYLGQDDVNCSVNSTLSSSLCEKMSTLTDAGELCRCWQQIKDEVSRISALSSNIDPTVTKLQEEVRSLEQQVIASDKQVRSTRAFLEEQAVEREQERDEATQCITELSERVRTKDRQLAGKELLEQDMEGMAQQIVELQASLESEMEKRASAEATLEQTLQKVASLRDVIETLEMETLECHKQLEIANADNLKLQEQLIQNSHQSLERENAQRESYSDFVEYVARLEDELTSLRHRLEATGPESLAFARVALRDLEAMVARRTRELELVQVAWNAALSSASEELSTRDHADITRCVTPDEMAGEPGVGLCEDVERLKERLLKHARVEEAALKRIKELEVVSSKRDELQFDLEAAMRRVDDLLSENGTIKARLEKERSRIQSQLSSAELEIKIRELEEHIEKVTDELQMERKLVLEKSRREERLQDALDSRENEMSEENKALKLVQDRLKSEKSQRLALESRISEFNQLFEEKNEIIGELRSLIESQSRELSNISQLSNKDVENLRAASESKVLELSNLCEEKEKQIQVLRDSSEERLLEMSALCEKKDKQIAELRNLTDLHLQDLSSLTDCDSKKSSIDETSAESGTPQHLGLSRIKRNADKILLGSRSSSSSSTSSKRVRFCNPESFVGSSLTPIRTSDSVMRDPPCDQEWSVLAQHSKKQMPWESISSVAALHLSPRGARPVETSDLFYSPIPNNSSIQASDDCFSELKLRLKNEIVSLQTKLTSTTKLLESSEMKYNNDIQRLELELLRNKQQAVLDCQEMENAKKVCEDAIKQLRDELEQSHLKMLEQQNVIHTLETKLKLATNNEESEKEKGMMIITNLQSQVESVTTELEKQQSEVSTLKTILKETLNELGSVKSARNEMILEKRQSVEIAELDKHKRVVASLSDELQKLNENHNSKLHELNLKDDELKSVRLALVAKNEEMAKFKKQIAAKVELFEKDNNRITEMEQIIKEYEETLSKLSDERDHLKFDNIKLVALMQTLKREVNSVREKSVIDESMEESWKKLFLDASAKVSNLQTCLEQSMARISSLESNLVIAQTCLAASEGKTASLQAELLVVTKKVEELSKQLQSVTQLDSSQVRSGHLAAQLETAQKELMTYRKEARQMNKVHEELLAHKNAERELKIALKAHFEMEKDMMIRENSLKEKLKNAEKELLRLQYESDLKDVNVRGLEKLHHHTLALRNIQGSAGGYNKEVAVRDVRSVRSAGDGEDRPSDMKWTIHRLESYRKALVWQKRFLQDSRGRAFHRSYGRRSLRSVVFVVIALQRMRFLVRRWKHSFKLPPLVSPPRRERDGLLMLTTPPGKDTNQLRVNQIK